MARHVAEVLQAGEVTRAREAWPDTLRVVIITGVIVMHAATGYVVDIGWYYEERTSSEAWQIALTVPAFLGGCSPSARCSSLPAGSRRPRWPVRDHATSPPVDCCGWACPGGVHLPH